MSLIPLLKVLPTQLCAQLCAEVTLAARVVVVVVVVGIFVVAVEGSLCLRWFLCQVGVVPTYLGEFFLFLFLCMVAVNLCF